MKTARKGDRVSVHYIGTLDNGRIFDTRDEDCPLLITLGAQEIFPHLEQAIIGMRPGEVKNVILKAEQAYGLRVTDNFLRVARDLFPEQPPLKPGQKLNLQFKDGGTCAMRVVQVEPEQVLLDANHDLAGCDLTFALKLEAILSEHDAESQPL
ncbi:MAG: FKBP-type peptidyl-prolyl cis-trans isomerase [Desulfuromonadaceae bacterium]|nr:FKBP-type peptidyl-prolyl cis-trans isomerase [Desulfuromonadaceae bacterium]